jgi:RNA 2',3'-cyclic 3'-phosphodiesterase
VTDDERVRLFVALELPDRVRDDLASWIAPILAATPALRPVAPESMHVTLCFLGWRRAGEVPAIATACAAASSVARPRLTATDALWLPPRRPRVLSVSLADVSARLSEAQGRLSRALAAGGWYVPEKRPFLAHVTVARVGKGGRVGRGTALSEPPRLSFEGLTVTLFQSRLSPRGAEYVELARVELGS